MAMNPNISGSLEDQVGELRLRVQRLEQALRVHGIVVERAETAPAIAATPSELPAAPSQPAPSAAVTAAGFPQPPQARPFQAPVSPPRFGHEDQVAKEDNRSLESRIGSQWFNRVGILAMLIGVAWFLKLAFDNHW